MWLVYSLATVACWALWGMLGKVALRTTGWAQASLLFGLATAVVCGALMLRARDATWSVGDLLVPTVTAVVGALGVATFYLALEHGRASVVVPVIGVYPVIAAVLAVVFLGETLAPLQIAGVGLAAVAIVLIAVGG